MRRSGLLRAVVVLLDLVSVILGLRIAHALWTWWRPHLDQVLHIRWWELWITNPFMPSGFLLLIAWGLILRQAGLYDPGRMTSSPRIAAGLTRAASMLLVLVMVLQFLLPDRTYSRFLVLAFCILTATITGVLRLGFFRVQPLLPRPITQSPVAIVGIGPEALDMASRLVRHGHHAYRVAGFIRPEGWEGEPEVPTPRILGSVPELQQLVNRFDLRVIVLASPALHRDDALRIATVADKMGLQVMQVPLSWGVASPRVTLTSLGDLQLIDLATLAYPTLAEQLKRTLDLFIVITGGTVLLLPLLGVALAIKLQDGGPVFYIQPRAGKGGRQFPFYKFRSMVVDADARRHELLAQNEADGVLFKMRNDPRITPVGRFIRRYSLDEFPQLINVLRGDMNLVGPRPLPMRDLDPVADDPELSYWFDLRGKVKPGITGPWQVTGRSDLGFGEMLRLDIDYIQGWSLWLDLVLLMKTIPAVLGGRGAR